jgi:hypothetical protein
MGKSHGQTTVLVDKDQIVGLDQLYLGFMKSWLVYFALWPLATILAQAPVPSFAQGAVEPPGASILHLRLLPRPDYQALKLSPYQNQAIDPSLDPLARVRLFESSNLIAELGKDGRLHYRLPAVSVLGGRINGQVSTNSAKLSLSWQPGN